MIARTFKKMIYFLYQVHCALRAGQAMAFGRLPYYRHELVEMRAMRRWAAR